MKLSKTFHLMYNTYIFEPVLNGKQSVNFDRDLLIYAASIEIIITSKARHQRTLNGLL